MLGCTSFSSVRMRIISLLAVCTPPLHVAYLPTVVICVCEWHAVSFCVCIVWKCGARLANMLKTLKIVGITCHFYGEKCNSWAMFLWEIKVFWLWVKRPCRKVMILADHTCFQPLYRISCKQKRLFFQNNIRGEVHIGARHWKSGLTDIAQ